MICLCSLWQLKLSDHFFLYQVKLTMQEMSVQSPQQALLVHKPCLSVDELVKIVNREETSSSSAATPLTSSPHCVMYLNLDIDSETAAPQVLHVSSIYLHHMQTIAFSCFLSILVRRLCVIIKLWVLG